MDSQDLTPNVGTPEENKVVDSSNVNAETPAVAEEQVEKPAVAEEQVEKPAVVEEQVEAASEAVEEAPVPEPAVVETPQAADEPAVDEPKANEAEEKAAEEPKVYNTKGEVLQRVIELAHGEEVPDKKEVDLLKTIFYKLHSAEREAAEKAYLEAGGDPESYQVTPDEQEEKFKAEMALIKERRSKAFQEQENEKAENLKRKLEIIEKVKGMVDSPESANKAYPEFKRLQQEWKEIKAVPAERASELWKTYQHYVEQFYDQLRLNIEAREYDFRKNLEIKTKICEAAEKLAEETDVISAFHQLQELHQQYREAGPVAKDLREEVWTRFKAASSVINKRHQQHFEELRSKEEENLTKKTELCEKVEAIAKEENKTAADWERHTREIIAIQGEWRNIGFAPQKMNVKIFERFRAACDDFFGRKTQYFRNLKSQFAENAEKKRALVEQAKALQDSTDWKATSEKLAALQKEWKTIGTVPKKLGDQLWNEFLGACNKFFEARNAVNAGVRSEERENLAKKRDVIARLKALAEEPGDDTQKNVQALVDEYSAIGHVPYRDKDKLFKEYHEVLDKIYKELNISVTRRRLDNFKSNLRSVAEKGVGALDNERTKLMRRYEGLKQEIQTYENNIGFLSVSSKKGNSLIDEMNRKVQKLKDDLALVKEKIKAIDAENESASEEE
ncbi:MAG: DUF349 domain-containing protein [Prevotella sp.]|nr:DUF349 domain-containing protein [Prevotella sp.]